MAVQIQLRNDTAANWTSANPTLAAGEIGIENDTDLFKIGDGVTAWDSLSYGGIQGEAGVVAATSPLSYDSNTQTISIDLSNYDTSSEVNTKIANLVDSAPTTLDTLNELAAALGDDADFSTTVTNSIATKAPLAQTLNAQSANYTLQSSDTSAVIKASGTITITVPDAVFSAGERVDVVNTGTGVITFAEGSGVTLLSKDSAVTIDTQYAAASIIFDSASQAFLIGDLA